MFKVGVSWRVVDDDAAGFDVIVDTVLRVFHQVLEVLDVADAKEEVVTFISDVVGIICKFGSELDKISSLLLFLVVDSDVIAGSGQEESELVTSFTETNPADLSLLIVLDNLHAIFLDPVW